MSLFDHENIIKLIDFKTNEQIKQDGATIDNHGFLALEYCENGDLYDYIANAGELKESLVRYYFRQLLLSIEYIH